MATIADVAKAAGVARSTVSYALSGRRVISQETRDRIERAIVELGFTPNAGARALATNQTMILGLFVQFHPDEFAPAMLEYVLPISDTARQHGYDVLMVTEADGAAALRRITSTGMVDGVVLLDVTHDDPRLAGLRASRVPGSMVGLPGDPSGLDVFDLDFGEAARVLVDRLHDLGHRDVALVTPPRHVYERGGAYAWRFRDAALERGAQHGMRITAHDGESQQPAVARNLNAVLDARPGATALVVHNDASVAALPTVLRERSVEVPRDLSVVSLYSDNFGRSFSLAYTAVDTVPDELGHRAVRRLLQRITDPEQAGPPTTQFVTTRVTDRGSAARVPESTRS
ncbi:LacI family DNA-binding transcriptional regulator [Curtobacterium sp. SP.BCo]|uniref:LacI family DNA-binding transcriptional regulator n=1 Tax=Curtobacterium sp. SP.BCo TaxID=3435229 RepID=UPI003F7395DA